LAIPDEGEDLSLRRVDASEIRFRAERRIGELMDLQNLKPGNPNGWGNHQWVQI
jgi:hypothetical protein